MNHFEKPQEWKIAFYAKQNRIYVEIETFLESAATQLEAFEIMEQFCSGFPPHSIVRYAAEDLFGPTCYEVRLLNASNYYREVIVVHWDSDTIAECLEDYRNKNFTVYQVVANVTVETEEGDDPELWDWEEILATDSFDVVDSTKVSVLGLVHPPEREED